jgi:hypothetical protein
VVPAGAFVTEHEAAIIRSSYLKGTGEDERGLRRRVTVVIRRCHGFPVSFRSDIYK